MNAPDSSDLPFGCKVFRLQDFPKGEGSSSSKVHDFVNADTGADFGAGVVHWKDTEVVWRLWYNEILTCFSTDGEFSIIIAGNEVKLEPGDTIWLPKGTSLTYKSKGSTTCFFSVTPPDLKFYAPTGLYQAG